MKFKKFLDWLSEPIQATSLAIFRICLGIVFFLEILLYFRHGWIARDFLRPVFFTSYPGFSWLRPLPGFGMYFLFLCLGGLALCIALGLFYRVAIGLFFLGYTYFFLLDQTTYQNHLYLLSLLSFIFCFFDAARVYSLDAWRDKKDQRPSRLSAWPLHLLRFQIALIYFYGGLAKVNSDWLHGQPMKIWLAGKTGFPFLGSWLGLPGTALLFSYSGLAIDLTLPFLLYCRRTRWMGVVIAVLFHGLNFCLWDIGVFPILMVAALSLYFPPDWPVRFFGGPSTKPFVKFPETRLKLWQVVCLGTYVGVQLFLPLRYLFYPGPVAWTRLGQKFAWRMKLENEEGDLVLVAREESSGRFAMISYLDFLTLPQRDLIPGEPEMIRQLSRFLGDEFRRRGIYHIGVHADSTVSLNGRAPEPLIDPGFDLTRKGLEKNSNWILPLH